MISKQCYVKMLASVKELDDTVCLLCNALGIQDSVFDPIVSNMLQALCEETGDVEPSDNQDLDWQPLAARYLWEGNFDKNAGTVYDTLRMMNKEENR